jgi:hypothetical protein
MFMIMLLFLFFATLRRICSDLVILVTIQIGVTLFLGDLNW